MNQGKKLMYFSVGLVLGVIIGASIVWWLQNYDFKIWFTFSGKNNEVNSLNLKSETKDTILVTSKDFKKNPANKQQYDYSNKKESIDTSGIDNINHIDTSSVKLKSNSNINDEIIVAKDELLYVRNIKIEGTKIKASMNLDSLLVNDKTSKNNNLLRVEFWRSPINYRGYLLTDNKLVLYGIYIFEDVSLEIRNNKLYMLYQNNYFLLEKNDDFQPFISSKLPLKKVN